MTNTYSDEWRHSPRFDYESPVDLVLNGRLHKEMTSDISDTGIFLKSRHPEKYNVHDKLIIAFQGPDSKPVKHIGRVARKTDEGIGVLYVGENHIQKK